MRISPAIVLAALASIAAAADVGITGSQIFDVVNAITSIKAGTVKLEEFAHVATQALHAKFPTQNVAVGVFTYSTSGPADSAFQDAPFTYKSTLYHLIVFPEHGVKVKFVDSNACANSCVDKLVYWAFDHCVKTKTVINCLK